MENIQDEKFIILPYMFEGTPIKVLFDNSKNAWMSLHDYHLLAYKEDWRDKLSSNLSSYQEKGNIKEISHTGEIFYYGDADVMREVSLMLDDIDDGSGLYSRLLEWTNTVFCYYAARGDLKLGLIAQNMKEMLDMLELEYEEYEEIESLKYEDWMFSAPMKYWIESKLGIKTPIFLYMISKHMDNTVPSAVRILNHPNTVRKEGGSNVYYRFLLPYIQMRFKTLKNMIENSPEWIINKIKKPGIYREKVNLQRIQEGINQGKSTRDIIKDVFGLYDESNFEFFCARVIVDACENGELKV